MEMLKSSRVAVVFLAGAVMVMMMIPTNMAETEEGKQQQWSFLSHPDSWAALASMAPLSSPAPSSSSSSLSPPASSVDGPSPSESFPSSTMAPTLSPSFAPSSLPAENSASILSYGFITVLAAVSVSCVMTSGFLY